MLMGPDDGGINKVNRPVHATGGVGLRLGGREQTVPEATFTPAVEAAGDCAPRSEALREITPRCTSADNPADAIDDRAVVFCWSPSFRFLRWEQRLKLRPLLIGQVSSTHGG